MIKKYIKGSILDATQKYIGHGCNCQNVMGSGVARVLFKKYPTVKSAYHEHMEYELSNVDKTSSLLGSYHVVEQLDGKSIVNILTQDQYGRQDLLYANYDAIYNAFLAISKSNITEIAIPKIGCGLAGGDWNIVKQIISNASGDDLDVFVYYLED